MKETIAILGANGVYGRHLTPRLVAAGYQVRALVRRPEAAAVARACGAEVAIADIFDEASLRAGLASCDVGINLATSLPRPGKGGDFGANDRVRRDGVPIWMRACEAAGVGRVMQQSIAWVNSAGEDIADEDTVCDVESDAVAASASAVALAMEELSGSRRRLGHPAGRLFYAGDWLRRAWFRGTGGKLSMTGDGSGCRPW